MPNIVSSSCTSTGISVTASNGASVTIPTGNIYAIINGLSQANPDVFRETVERTIAGMIVNALGEANVLADQIVFHCNLETGAPDELTFLS